MPFHHHLFTIVVGVAFVALGCGASSTKTEGGNGAAANGTGGGAGVGGGGHGGSAGSGTGGDAGSSGTGGVAGSSGASGSSGAAGSAGAAGERPCSFEAGDHSADCPEPCAIETDTLIRCEDSEFGNFGFRVGAAPETTYLAVTSTNLALVGEVGASSFERHSLPVPDWTRNVLQFAVSPDGAPHVAISGPGALFFAAPLDEGFATEMVVEYDGASKLPIDMTFDAEGTVHLGMTHGGSIGSYAWARRSAPGSWELEGVQPGTRFSLSQEGQPVSYPVINSEIRAVYAGGEVALARSPLARFVPLPHQFGGSGPVHGIVVQGDDAVRIVRLRDGSLEEILLPESPLWAQTCRAINTSFGATVCMPATCLDTSAGVVPESIAVDRAADGSVLVAYVNRRRDRDLAYEIEGCHPEVGCYCREVVGRDESVDRLHVVRIADDGDVSEVLVLPIDPVWIADRDGSPEVKRSLDLDIHGDAMAIGIWTGSHIRVLRVGIGE